MPEGVPEDHLRPLCVRAPNTTEWGHMMHVGRQNRVGEQRQWGATVIWAVWAGNRQQGRMRTAGRLWLTVGGGGIGVLEWNTNTKQQQEGDTAATQGGLQTGVLNPTNPLTDTESNVF